MVSTFHWYVARAPHRIHANLSEQTYLVDETSGTLIGHRNEQLPLDHFNMNKFENEEDNNYRCVSREVVIMAKKSIAMINRGKAEPKMLGYRGNTNGFEYGPSLFPDRIFELPSGRR